MPREKRQHGIPPGFRLRHLLRGHTEPGSVLDLDFMNLHGQTKLIAINK